ncbi:UNKNOWN [Stylonychia lemnae]|uniref:Uncharacterized protein n=1 Tax=Stylonychia lemnae TaxID=5949 RepID=A0A078B3V9_STYLE|nr:UNKNOWN [Stylonychia lemnae]|eukprot:CDW88911.1 UNKNOWN [Stylonychia lemnae]
MGARLSENLPRNPHAKHLILIYFCGIRSYEGEAHDMVSKLNKKFPGVFNFEVSRDEGFTNRLECIVRFDYTKSKKQKDMLIHSKKAGMGQPSDNWNGFLDRAKEALFNYHLLQQQ